MAKKASSEEVSVKQSDLAAALVAAIEAAKPVAKKTAFNRKRNTPWAPNTGTPRLKLKRKTFHHGIPLGERISNEEIALCNKLRPGLFLDGHVRVVRRRDKGIDIDYPIKTASQKLKLINLFGIRTFKELLEQLVAEGSAPKKQEVELDE